MNQHCTHCHAPLPEANRICKTCGTSLRPLKRIYKISIAIILVGYVIFAAYWSNHIIIQKTQRADAITQTNHSTE